jgi:hypothetical protein
MLRIVRRAMTARRPYGGRLAATYALLLGLGIVGAVLVQRSPKDATVQRYGPNLVTNLAAILITVVVVERLLNWQRLRDSAPVRTVALRRFWHQLNGLTYMLLFAYKAASPSGSPQPTELEPLLQNWQHEARFLDFRLPYGPDGPPRSWHQYAAEVMTRFEDGVRDVTDRYLGVLGSDLPAAAEDIIDHPVFQVIKNGPAIERFDAASGLDLPRCSFLVRSVEDPDRDSLADFAQLMARAHEAYRRLDGPPVVLDARRYEDHLSPAWGSARYAPSTAQPT